jgi:hypothetical protein
LPCRTEPPPQGLGSTPDRVQQILKATDNATAALLAFDREIRGECGGAHNPNRDPATGRLAPASLKLYNIQLEDKPPTGTSAQAGIRRLDKAAQAGDEKAADMLRRECGRHHGVALAPARTRSRLLKAVRVEYPRDVASVSLLPTRLGQSYRFERSSALAEIIGHSARRRSAPRGTLHHPIAGTGSHWLSDPRPGRANACECKAHAGPGI